MRDYVMQSVVVFLSAVTESPVYAAIVGVAVVGGFVSALWAVYDYVLPRYRVWRHKHRPWLD